jgi:hypothetical protein
MGRFDAEYVEGLEAELERLKDEREKLKDTLTEVKRLTDIPGLPDDEWRNEGCPSTDTIVKLIRTEVEKVVK